MAAVLERYIPRAQPSASVLGAIARMQAAPAFFTPDEWNMLASYEGPVVSGNPKGELPDDLDNDDEA